eukprot:COSAG01_NODE_8905_length_2620_cov_50.763189_3_plen_371_part_01
MLTAARANQSHNRTRTRQQVLAAAGEPAKRSPRPAPPRRRMRPAPATDTQRPASTVCGTATGPSSSSSRAQRGALVAVSSESANKRGSPPTPQSDMSVGRRTKDESPAMTPVDSPGGGITRGKTVSAPTSTWRLLPLSLSLSLFLFLFLFLFLSRSCPDTRFWCTQGRAGAFAARTLIFVDWDDTILCTHDMIEARGIDIDRDRHPSIPATVRTQLRKLQAEVRLHHQRRQRQRRRRLRQRHLRPRVCSIFPRRPLLLVPRRSQRWRPRARWGRSCWSPTRRPVRAPSLPVLATSAFVPMDSTSGRTCQRLSLSRSCAWACGWPRPRPPPILKSACAPCARPGWIERSGSLCLPEVIQLVERQQLEVVYAR